MLLSNPICYAPDDGAGAAEPPASTPTELDIASLFDLAGPTLSPPEEPQQPAGAGNPPEAPAQPEPVRTGKFPTPAPKTPVAPAAPEAPMAQPTEPTPAPATAEQLAELRGQLAAHQALLTRPQQPAPAAAPSAAPKTAAEVFPVQIPDELVQAIRADDPVMARRGLEHLGSQLGARILNETQTAMTQHLHQMAQAIPQVITSMLVQHQQMQTWHDEFYREFPQLGATPELKQFVGQMAANLGKQGKITGLDGNARKIVARAVMEAILGPGKVQPAATSPAPAAPAAKRPAVASSGSRPMANGNIPDPNSAAAIQEILFGG